MSFEFKEFSTYENERWKNILIDGEHTDYFISNYGKILSFKKSQPYILKNNISSQGYQYVCLVHNHHNFWRLVHRLVGTYFIPIPENLVKQGYTMKDLDINHIDGTLEGKSRNTINNLEWATSSENKYHAYNTGLKKQGEESKNSIYSNKQIESVCQLLQDDKLGVRDIWKTTNVDLSTISQILSGKQWKSISKNYDFSKRKKQKNAYPKEIKEKALKYLKERNINKMNFSEIGKAVGMSRTAVWYLNKYYLQTESESSTTRES